MPEPKPIEVSASAFIPVLIQIVTKLLAMAGAALVARGFLTDGQLNAAVPAIAQEIVGALIALGAVVWAAIRSKRGNDQKVTLISSPETYVPASVGVVTDKTTPLPPAGLLAIPLLFVAVGVLGGCSTASTVRLNADKAFYTAQVAFRAAQQTTLVTCTAPPARLVEPCGAAIDILHTGAQAEAAGFTAQQAGNATNLQAALETLIALPSQLAALGVLEAN